MLIGSIDYQKLEKVEVGGLVGRWYNPVVEGVYLRFSKFMERIVSITYDPLDLLNETNNILFLEDYNFYLNMSDDFDKCLATISIAYFKNNDNLTSLHKVNNDQSYLN